MRPPVPPAVVIGTFAWRLTLAFCAFWGWWLYGHDPKELIFLTQSGNLLTSIVFVLVAFYGLVVGLAYQREPATQCGEAPWPCCSWSWHRRTSA